MKPLFKPALMTGLLLSLSSLASADEAASKLRSEDSQKTYIVQLKDEPLATHRKTIPAFALTPARKNKKLDRTSSSYRAHAEFLTTKHQQAMALVPAAHKVHDYKVAFNGFAARMTTSEVELLKNRKDVVAVWEDRRLKLQTNSTRSFLGLDRVLSPWSLGATGEDVVIGVIDSGIHPEHPSLADQPTRKRGNYGRKIPYGPVPKSFTGVGCDFGNTEANPKDLPFNCNNKLIKAQSFSAGFLSAEKLAEHEFVSARDADGHGTHTATTAGGNFGVQGSIKDESIGILSGMAPRARIAAYKVCWDALDPEDDGCNTSDSMAAIDQAVADGVDVINFSVGGRASNPFNRPTDIAFLNAADAGVFVAVSAGNSGPGSATTGTGANIPWVTSVAAADDNESFGTGLRLDAPADLAGLLEGLEGGGPVKLADIGAISAAIVAAEPLDGCTALTNAEAIAGNIALVMRGACSFVDKYQFAADAGAQAIVVFNDGAAADRIDPIVMGAATATIPGIMIRHPDGERLLGNREIAGTLSADIQVPRVNRIAGFSSRGMNRGAPDIIKPDISAPGVGIFAGVSPTNRGGEHGELFRSINGTSMASPHVAGIMALLKQVYPEWTPAMAKSALMTTARQNMRKSFSPAAADPFDMGAGFMQPSRAFFPGLVYDIELEGYNAFRCGVANQPATVSPEDCAALQQQGFSLDSSDLNLPSIAIAELNHRQTVTRTVTSVAPGTRWYWVSVQAPAGFQVELSPRLMRIKRGETASYTVTFTSSENSPPNQWAFGSLTWSSGINRVRSPIALRSMALDVEASASAEGSSGSLDIPLNFNYSGAYTATVKGLAEAVLFPGVIEDKETNIIVFDIPEGTTQTRIALFDADVGTGDGSDDLDLIIHGPGPDFPLVDSSASNSSTESVKLLNPTAGSYTATVVDFDSAPGATAYTLFNFNLNGDAGNTVVNAPAMAKFATTGTLNLRWDNLAEGTRALGVVEHGNGEKTLSTTELMINTQ